MAMRASRDTAQKKLHELRMASESAWQTNAGGRRHSMGGDEKRFG
jgi:hypothetical protein